MRFRTLESVSLAFRSLSRRPVFLSVAVLSLGVGVGAVHAVYTFADALFLHGRGEDPGLLAVVSDREDRSEGMVPSSTLRALAGESSVFETVGGYKVSLALLGPDAAQIVTPIEIVSLDYFDAAGVAFLEGRGFSGVDPHEVAISERMADRIRDQRGGEALGSFVRLDGSNHRVVAVVPRRYVGRLAGVRVDMWRVPKTDDPLADRSYGLVRLVPGVPQERASMALERLGVESGVRGGHRLVPASAIRWGPSSDRTLRTAVILTSLVLGSVFLLACLNVSGFATSRALERADEYAIRKVVGATSGSLFGQGVAEGLVLAVLAFFLGSTIGGLGPELLRLALLDPGVTLDLLLEPGWGAHIVTLAVATGSGLLLTVPAAFQAARVDTSRVTVGRGGGTRTMAGMLIDRWVLAGQVALASALLVVGGAAVASFLVQWQTPMGWDASGLQVAWITHSNEEPHTLLHLNELLVGDGAVPEGIALASRLPITPGPGRTSVGVVGRVGSGVPMVLSRVSETYFSVLGIPIEESRYSRGNGTRSVVLSRFASDVLWPDQDGLGQVVRIEDDEYVVAGIAGEVRRPVASTGPEPWAYVFVEERSEIPRTLYIVSRSSGRTLTSIADAIQRNQDFSVLATFEASDEARRAQGPLRLIGFTLATLGALALTIAGLGIYGVTRHTSARRTWEMGVRMSLGATPARVIARVGRDSLSAAGVGLGFGLWGGSVASGLVRAFLPGAAGSLDMILAGVAILVVFVSAVATLGPARKAVALGPGRALRLD